MYVGSTAGRFGNPSEIVGKKRMGQASSDIHGFGNRPDRQWPGYRGLRESLPAAGAATLDSWRTASVANGNSRLGVFDPDVFSAGWNVSGRSDHYAVFEATLLCFFVMMRWTRPA